METLIRLAYEGEGDPQLPYGLFEDISMSYELRAMVRAQFELAVFLMPDNDEWTPDVYDELFKFIRYNHKLNKNTS